MEENQKQQNSGDSLPLDEFIEFQEDKTDNIKNLFARQIMDSGDELLDEISRKKELENSTKKPLIEYILTKSDKYTSKQLYSYEYNDVEIIYNKIREENRSIFSKFLKFISFNN